MDCIVWVQEIRSIRDCPASADVIGMTVCVNDGVNRALRLVQQTQIGTHVPQRINNDRMSLTDQEVTQASARWPAYLIDLQSGGITDLARLIVLSPSRHSTGEAHARVSHLSQTLRHELRCFALGTHGENGRAF